MSAVRTMSAFPAILLVAALSTPAIAEKKNISYSTKMGPVISRTVTDPGDRPGHEITRTVRRDMTTSSDSDWDGAPVVVYGNYEMSGGNATISGFALRTHKNGDQTFYTYQGRLRVVGEGNPPPMAGEGTVELVGGTGKFANAKGSGTWASEKGQSQIKLSVEY